MSHALLIQRGVGLADPKDKTRMHPAHRQVLQERKAELEIDHAPRITNVKKERAILRGDVWVGGKVPGVHYIAPPIAHTLGKRVATMMLPKPAILNVESFSSEGWAKEEADITQRWAYGMDYRMRAHLSRQHWARETVNHGVGVLHLIADRWADEDREVPLILDVADSAATLYHMGPRHRPDYVFIKHRMSVNDMRRFLDHEPRNTYGDTVKIDTWCYYTEERIRNPKTGKVEVKLFYAVLEGNEPLSPLIDITKLWPSLPVYLCFNTDGYSWRGEEAMNARGVWTDAQSMILYAIDLMSQMANGQLKYVNPALLIKRGVNDEGGELDDAPGTHNEVDSETDVKAFNQGQPSPGSMQMWPAMIQAIGEHTDPSLTMTQQKLEGVTSGAFMQSIMPNILETQQRQQMMEYGIADQVYAAMFHIASLTSPKKGMRMRGLDPRDGQHVNELVTPDMLRNVDVYAKLTRQVPAQLYQHINMMMQLGEKGYFPQAMVTEEALKLLDMQYKDMTTVSRELGADQYYKAQVQAVMASAQRMLPMAYQQAYNQGMSPNMLNDDGTAPYQLSSNFQDPLTFDGQEQSGPVQQAAENTRAALVGDY